MPKNPNIKKVLVIGSGPIVIGQAAEFDYAGTQACRSLKEEGMEVVLLNSNPATIMTDKDIADQRLHRAADRRSGRAAHPEGKTGQRSSDSGRTGRTEPCDGTRRNRLLKRKQRTPDRYHSTDHQKSRGPSGIQGYHGKDRRAGSGIPGCP